MKGKGRFAFLALVAAAFAVVSVGIFSNTPAMGQPYALDNAAAGLDALHRGAYDEAIRALTAAINEGTLPQNDLEFAFLNRGKAYLAKGDYNNAVPDLKKAADLKPDDADAKRSLERAISGGGVGGQGAVQYRNSLYPFALTLPAGWTVHEGTGEPTKALVEFHSPRFDVEHAICTVGTDRNAETENKTQDRLNARVAHREVESVPLNAITPMDPATVLNNRAIAKIGSLTVQEGDLTFTKSGVRVRLKMMIAFVPGRDYAVSCAAPASVFPEFQTEFEAVLQSFSVGA